jgi:single-strand selective monofunctional uracil DNA glycosylase
MPTPTEISRQLHRDLQDIEIDDPVDYIYRPLDYAWEIHEQYLTRFGSQTPRPILLVGMNPGPWGMGQTGVPFGDVDFVGDWMGLDGEVDAPDPEHPNKTVDGLDCPRNEVSGSRLWGWARDRYETPEAFFERFYVHNYCPLLMLEDTDRGRNVAPSKLRKAQLESFTGPCDRALRELIAYFQPNVVLGVGNWARDRIKTAVADWDQELDFEVGRILHPSPASPMANRGWAEQAERQFAEQGIALDAL